VHELVAYVLLFQVRTQHKRLCDLLWPEVDVQTSGGDSYAAASSTRHLQVGSSFFYMLSYSISE